MSFGDELRRERELRQISLREVSQATKISLRYLEALERNDFAGLPGGAFNRGFVRAYSEHIGIDSEAMVNAYLLEEQRGDPSVAGLLRGKLARGTEPAAVPGGLRRGRRRVLFGVLAMAALIAGALLLWSALALKSRVQRDGKREIGRAVFGCRPTDQA